MREHTAARIRRAIASGEFGKAQAAWREYARELEDAIRAGAGGPALAEARALLDEAALAVKCRRAHASARIAERRASQAYGNPQPAPQRRLRAIF